MDEKQGNASLSQDDEASILFDRATRAQQTGNSNLALHLYIAAYEDLRAAAEEDTLPIRAEAALRSAWAIALSTGDRRSAETIFQKLEPFLDMPEAAAFAQRLAQLAIDDLGGMGVDQSELPPLPDISEFIDQFPAPLSDFLASLGAREGDDVGAGAAGDSPDSIDSPSDGDADGVPVESAAPPMATADSPASAIADAGSTQTVDGVADATSHQDAPSHDDLEGDAPQASLPSMVPSMVASAHDLLDDVLGGYASQMRSIDAKGTAVKGTVGRRRRIKQPKGPLLKDVPGFEEAKRDLLSLGVGIDPGSKQGQHIRSEVLYHGLATSISLPSVILSVPEGTDCGDLAHALAVEMGVPYAQVDTHLFDVGARGLVGPEVAIRVHGDFVPVVSVEYPQRCVLFISAANLWPEGLAAHSRKLGDLVSSIAGSPEAVVLLSVAQGTMPPDDLLERLGDNMRVITLLPPQTSERERAWRSAAQGHQSLVEPDFKLLALVTEGMMPDVFEAAVRDACTAALELGLREDRRCTVTTLDVLCHLATYASDEDSRQRIIDAAGSLWSSFIADFDFASVDLDLADGQASASDEDAM